MTDHRAAPHIGSHCTGYGGFDLAVDSATSLSEAAGGPGPAAGQAQPHRYTRTRHRPVGRRQARLRVLHTALDDHSRLTEPFSS